MISIVVISKDENALEYTLSSLGAVAATRDDVEIVVVDASEGRLDHLRDEDAVTWINFAPVPGKRITIPHQRNLGVSKAQGEIIVFTDAGCEPRPGWLEQLTVPILDGRERVVTGVAVSRSGDGVYDETVSALRSGYVEECATISLAFRRSVFDEVGGFDENFDYGSDVDFSWRVRNAGVRIYRSTDAVVVHDWGPRKRQARRSYVYGQARARLYLKHAGRWRSMLRNDPVAVAYPLFLLLLPLTLRFRAYPALLAVPLWKNRTSRPIQVLVDHLMYGAGVLRELARYRR